MWSRPAEPRVAAAIAAAAILAFVGACGLLHVGFYKRGQLRDTQHYWVYGAAIVRGYVPYRDYDVDYPPGALPVFVLPAIGHDRPDRYPAYRGIFEWMMVACGCVLIALMGLTLRLLRATTGRMTAALGFVALSPLALGSLVLSRFDYYVAVFAAAGLAALVAGRTRTGSVVLALGAVTKLYPAFLLPLALADAWRRGGRREALRCAGLSAGVILLVIVPFVVVSPGGMRWMAAQQLTRPLQIESLGSGLLLAAHHLLGLGVTTGFGHGSQNLVGGLPDGVAAAQSILLAATLVGLWVAYARGPAEPERLVRYAAAVVCAYVALGKVLSPQYLIWLTGIVPLVRGRRGLFASGLLGLALVLTQLWFPHHYRDLAYRLDTRASFVMLERDLVLVALLVLLAWPERRPEARPSESAVPAVAEV